MKIGILGGDLIQPDMRGLTRYAIGLIRALGAAGAEVFVLTRQPVAPVFRDLPATFVAWWGGKEMLWEQIGVPRMAAKLKLDVVHAVSNRGLCALAPCATVLTRHDAIERMFPPDFPGNFRSRFRMWSSDEVSVRCASRVATVSETSRADVLKVWSIAPTRVIAAGQGIDGRFFTAPPKGDVESTLHRLGAKRPYFLYVGGMDKRKDVPTLVRGFARAALPGLNLVIAGPTRGELPAVTSAIEGSGLKDRVAILGAVDDRDLPALYAGARAFVYPSRYEGFGLQAAEALAMRVPLIVSDGGSLPEISGGHALQFPVGEVDQLASRLRECEDDAVARARRVEAGAAYAERFRWSMVVGKYLDLYRSTQSN